MSEVVSLGGGQIVVHLTYRENRHNGEWRIACMPMVGNFATSAHHTNYHRSNDTRAVTCDRCKATDTYKQVKSTER